MPISTRWATIWFDSFRANGLWRHPTHAGDSNPLDRHQRSATCASECQGEDHVAGESVGDSWAESLRERWRRGRDDRSRTAREEAGDGAYERGATEEYVDVTLRSPSIFTVCVFSPGARIVFSM